MADADIKWRSHAYAHSPWFNVLIRHPRILDAIEDVIGPNILVWTSTFFIKEPHSPTFAAWHQDGAYFGLEPKEQVCAWVALTDASKEAGCMEMLSSRGAPRLLHHAALGLKNSINRAGQTILDPLTIRCRWRWRCGRGSSRCTMSWRCTVRRRTMRRTGGWGSG